MNTKNLLRVAQAIEDRIIPNRSFDLEEILLHPAYSLFDLRILGVINLLANPELPLGFTKEDASAYLELTELEANALFDSDNHVTPTQAVQVLRNAANTGAVAWPALRTRNRFTPQHHGCL